MLHKIIRAERNASTRKPSLEALLDLTSPLFVVIGTSRDANDAIIYGGAAHLFVSGPDGDAQQLASDMPSSNSCDYGKPFEETFKAVKGDFYAIDGSLFSPARVIVTAMESGRSFHAGEVNEDILNTSFGYEGT